MMYNGEKDHFRKRGSAMYVESVSNLHGSKKAAWAALLASCGLEQASAEYTVLVWEEDVLVATGSRDRNILKCIAVDAAHQGQGLTSVVLTHLRQNAFQSGFSQLFLYTKPQNEHLFTPLFFYPIARTGKVLLMEDDANGIRRFLSSLRAPRGECGAIVMNADPFTLGHRYLVETAADQCRQLLVFVLSEDQGRFPADVRLDLVRQGTADIPNVTVLPTGPYLISSATFPTYFLKDRDHAADIHCMLDVEIFVKHFAPHFSIVRRFVGTEPLSALTARYNEILKAQLPDRGIQVTELPRLEQNGTPISASAVRKALNESDWETVRTLVPQTTFNYLFEEEAL